MNKSILKKNIDSILILLFFLFLFVLKMIIFKTNETNIEKNKFTSINEFQKEKIEKICVINNNTDNNKNIIICTDLNNFVSIEQIIIKDNTFFITYK